MTGVSCVHPTFLRSSNHIPINCPQHRSHPGGMSGGADTRPWRSQKITATVKRRLLQPPPLCTARSAPGRAACRRSSERAALATTRRESNNGGSSGIPRLKTRCCYLASGKDAASSGRGGRHADGGREPGLGVARTNLPLRGRALQARATRQQAARNKPAPRRRLPADRDAGVEEGKKSNCDGTAELLRLTVLR